MAEVGKPICLKCDAPLPTGSERCPGCGCAFVFCSSDDCAQAYPSEERFCPYCGFENQFWEEPGAAMEPNAEAAPADWQQAFQSAFKAEAEPATPESAAAPMLPATPLEPALRSITTPLPATIGNLVPLAGLPSTGFPSLSSAASTPVTLETLFTGSPRRGQKSVLRIRVRGAGVQEDTQVRVAVSSELLDQTIVHETRLGSGEVHELGSLKFVAKVSGTDEMRFQVDLASESGVPRERYVGVLAVNVEESPSDVAGRIEAGGDVFIFGGAGVPGVPGLPGLPNPLANWQPVELTLDAAYQRRLAQFCPKPLPNAPAIPERGKLWPITTPFQALVRLTSRSTGRTKVYVIQYGTSAAIGRGGDSDVSWWIKPAPYDEKQHGRLSRRHTTFFLRHGRAWATDDSTNGTWLNGKRMEKGAQQILADGDRLEPAKAFTFTVRLHGDGSSVLAIELVRSDALSREMSYLLTTGQGPLPLALEQEESRPHHALFVRGKDPGPVLAMRGPNAAKWQGLTVNQLRSLDDSRQAMWELLAEPLEQEECLTTG